MNILNNESLFNYSDWWSLRLLKCLWTDGGVWAYGFASRTQRMFSDTLCSSILCWVNYGDGIQLQMLRDLWEISFASEANITLRKAEALQEGEWVHTTAQILHKLPRSLQQLRNKQNQSSFSSFLLQYVAELVCMIGFHLPRKTLKQRTQLQRCTMLNLTTKYTTPSVSDDA